MNKTINNALSYRVEVLITPNWNQIIKWYFPKLKTNEAIHEFITKSIKKLKTDEDESLYNKRFIFLEFYDGISGLNLIWSRNYQQFFDNLEVQGNLLNEPDPYLIISPNQICVDGEIISKMPYNDIINFFVNIQQETKCANYHIKKFPEVLQDIFDKDKVSYAPINTDGDFQRQLYPEEELLESEWFEKAGVELYKQKVIQHIFETQYYSVAFGIKFFNPNFNLWNER